jgi:S-adenosylmethionine decarboxylase
MAPDNGDDYQASGPFEGPEKLLEIWFAPSPAEVPGPPDADGRTGLRRIDRKVWEDMLDIVKCKVLSTMDGLEMDAYLLRYPLFFPSSSHYQPPLSHSESSFFIFPHKLILKTCGTTLNLLGVPRILEIAAQYADLPTVYRCFYSRKSFMFPELQKGPHRDWKHEVEFLDNIFKDGAAYTIGKVNGDHWLLYIVSSTDPTPSSDHTLLSNSEDTPDYTIEILMSGLAKGPRDAFHFSETSPTKPPSMLAFEASLELGINEIFPSHLTSLDPYAFTPCGYSSNALIRLEDVARSDALSSRQREGYYTIHVTPEEGWSYASFECNVPLVPSYNDGAEVKVTPDIETLVKRVVSIFQPDRITLTLFISSKDNNDDVMSHVEDAQRAFRSALTTKNGVAMHNKIYRRTDKINYEFGDYDLAFASFELEGSTLDGCHGRH